MKQLVMISLLGIFYWATAYACGDGRDIKNPKNGKMNQSPLKKGKIFSINKNKAEEPAEAASLAKQAQAQ